MDILTNMTTTNTDSNSTSHKIISKCNLLDETIAECDRNAKYDNPVLLLGGTGTGKEVFAKRVHNRSRRKRIFVLNCGTIPPEMTDSVLFGHEKGAFTGAIARQSGWFEAADGHTLFLDEIGELSIPAQIKLLRVLQEGTFNRVGSTREISCNVRVICATNRPLDLMVANGEFREDLYFRLNHCTIIVPSLRERSPEHFRALALDALYSHSEKYKEKTHSITPEVWSALEAHTWPGNVRELKNVIEYACQQAGDKGEAITPEHLPANIAGLAGTVSENAPVQAAPARNDAEENVSESVLEKFVADHNNAREAIIQRNGQDAWDYLVKNRNKSPMTEKWKNCWQEYFSLRTLHIKAIKTPKRDLIQAMMDYLRRRNMPSTWADVALCIGMTPTSVRSFRHACK